MKIYIFTLPLACAFLLLATFAAIANRDYFGVFLMFPGSCAAFKLWHDAVDYMIEHSFK